MQNLTPRGTKNEDEVFIFPDSRLPRKTSPYRSGNSGTNPNDAAEICERDSKDRYARARNEDQRYGRDGDKLYGTEKTRTYEREREALGLFNDGDLRGKEYVTSKGFVWPSVASVTDTSQQNPRYVTSDIKQRQSSAVTTSSTLHKLDDLDQNQLRAKLRMLEREYARAKEIYGSPPPRDYDASDVSPNSRSRLLRDYPRRGPLKSLSHVDRSPNEKDIITTTEEVRKCYERSISDPRYSPGQLRTVIQKPSPLAREFGSRCSSNEQDPGVIVKFYINVFLLVLKQKTLKLSNDSYIKS